MKTKFTTSAQKTLSLSIDVILQKLEDEMIKETGYSFEFTLRKNIKQAKIEDGSKLIIAAFDKGNGKALAMLDYKDLPASRERSVVHKALKDKLEIIFK